MENVSLSKVSGVCAILTGILHVAAFGIISVGSPDLLDSNKASEFLPIVEEDKEVVATALWLFVLAPFLGIVAGLGIYKVLSDQGNLMQVAVVLLVVGLIFVTGRGLIDLATIYELSPGYADAAVGSATRATLEVMTDTLQTLGIVTDLIGGALALGIGVLFFSLAVLRTSFAPKWIGYLGLVSALLGGWISLLGPAATIFEIIGFVGLIGFAVWMIAMGVRLLRLQETGAAAS